MKVKDYIDTYLKDFIEHIHNDFRWKYEDGCILSGCEQLYKVTGEFFYKDIIKKYMDAYIKEDGTILTYDKASYNIDNINPGKVLFFLYDETRQEKYRRAIESLMDQLREHPRTFCGNFWHKQIYPYQIWLDGLYMAQPFYLLYETRFHKNENVNDTINQFLNVRTYLFDEGKRLYYHGYDEAKVQKWANKETGKSPNFWLRAMGWYVMALVDTIEIHTSSCTLKSTSLHNCLIELFIEAIEGLLQYQDKESKMFYQLIDRADIEENYLETSGSAMIAYSILKGTNIQLLPKNYINIGNDILNGIITEKLITSENGRKLTGICRVAGLGPVDARDGSTRYYFSEDIVSDDLKGVGAFIMAYAQSLQVKDNKN